MKQECLPYGGGQKVKTAQLIYTTVDFSNANYKDITFSFPADCETPLTIFFKSAWPNGTWDGAVVGIMYINFENSMVRLTSTKKQSYSITLTLVYVAKG